MPSADECNPIHMFFFPFMAHGHIIPTIDMAKLFASKGVKATIVTTPLNKPLISKAIEQSKNINIQTINFPCEEAGLPEGCENVDSLPSPTMFPTFCNATRFLQEPFEQLLSQKQPHCVVADMFFPWTTDSSAKFGIPRIVFHGFCVFSLCASECMRLYEPYNNVSSDSDLFVIPDLPGEIKMSRLQLPNYLFREKVEGTETSFATLLREIAESEVNSYGVIVNSFYELEHVYADYYKNVLGRKEWHIGPLSICNRKKEEKIFRGKEVSIDMQECIKWLDTKNNNSVIYVCFGSTTHFPNSQLREIAMALEASGKDFIWVVRKSKELEDGEEWLPEGFEKRMKGKGFIIRGWAPQVMILEHEAIGAFVTHCGWNSTLEGVVAGVPMVTWPVAAEQFYNEKLVTEVLQIGVAVGVKKWAGLMGEDCIKWDVIEKAIKRVMEGKEAEEMRKKAKVLAQMAMQALEEDGSSNSHLNALIEELGYASIKIAQRNDIHITI